MELKWTNRKLLKLADTLSLVIQFDHEIKQFKTKISTELFFSRSVTHFTTPTFNFSIAAYYDLVGTGETLRRST